MDLIQPEHLGTCIKAVTSDVETVIQVGEYKPEVIELIEEVKKQLAETKLPGEVIRLEKRLARLSGKVAVVKVGANSEVELKEKADRVEDAICATKAAIKEGIVPGGGIALFDASERIKETKKGGDVLLKAITAPFYTILSNSGMYGSIENKPEGFGLDVITGQEVNMIEAGIVDPLLVTKSALRNAASVAITILSTDCVINNLRINGSDR
jgi:chaperonin GroEL